MSSTAHRSEWFPEWSKRKRNTIDFFLINLHQFCLALPTPRSSVKKLAFKGKWQIDCVSTSIAFRVSSICSIIWWIDFLKIDFLVFDMFFRNYSVRVVPYVLTWFSLEDSKSSSRAWTLLEFRHLVFMTSTDFLLVFRLFVSHVFLFFESSKVNSLDNSHRGSRHHVGNCIQRVLRSNSTWNIRTLKTTNHVIRNIQ